MQCDVYYDDQSDHIIYYLLIITYCIVVDYAKTTIICKVWYILFYLLSINYKKNVNIRRTGRHKENFSVFTLLCHCVLACSKVSSL